MFLEKGGPTMKTQYNEYNKTSHSNNATKPHNNDTEMHHNVNNTRTKHTIQRFTQQ